MEFIYFLDSNTKCIQAFNSTSKVNKPHTHLYVYLEFKTFMFSQI